MAELRSLRKEGEPFDVYALSIDKPEDSKKLAQHLAADGKGEVGYRLLSDPGSQTIDAYGLRNPHLKGTQMEGLPHAATLVIGKDGKVAWMRIDEDYRLRPSNEEIRKALESLQGP